MIFIVHFHFQRRYENTADVDLYTRRWSNCMYIWEEYIIVLDVKVLGSSYVKFLFFFLMKIKCNPIKFDA